MTIDINLQIKGIESLVDAINNLASSYQTKTIQIDGAEEATVPVQEETEEQAMVQEQKETALNPRQYMSVLALARKMGRAERHAGLMARNIKTNFGDMVCKPGKEWLIDKSLGLWLYRNYSGRHRRLNYENIRQEYESQLN